MKCQSEPTQKELKKIHNWAYQNLTYIIFGVRHGKGNIIFIIPRAQYQLFTSMKFLTPMDPVGVSIITVGDKMTQREDIWAQHKVDQKYLNMYRKSNQFIFNLLQHSVYKYYPAERNQQLWTGWHFISHFTSLQKVHPTCDWHQPRKIEHGIDATNLLKVYKIK